MQGMGAIYNPQYFIARQRELKILHDAEVERMLAGLSGGGDEPRA